MKKFQIAKPYIDENDKKQVMEVLDSGWLSLGPKYKEFEQKICNYTRSKYACAVSSGTTGLHLLIRSFDIKDEDEVITTPFSFISSSNCILYERAKPAFVDIEDKTYNINPNNIEKAITKKTKAILVVHIFGQSANMEPIIRIAKKYKLKLIEDSCESLGAYYKGRMTGTLGDAGVYAFYPNKQMTTGEGGIIVTDSKEVYDLCDSMRNQGRGVAGDWLIHERLGYNYRIDELSAALGISQLEKIEWMVQQRRELANFYNEALCEIPGVITPEVVGDSTHSWFVYVIRITNGKRNKVMKKLSDWGIQTKPYLPVIHLQPFMKKMFGYKEGDFPVAEKIASQTLALPFYVGMTKEDVSFIISMLKRAIFYCSLSEDDINYIYKEFKKGDHVETI